MRRDEIEGMVDRIIGSMRTLGAEAGGLKEDCPISIIDMNKWEWPQGVGLFALYLYYKETGRQDILADLIGWFDSRISEGLPDKNVNTACPMLTLSYLAEETGSPDYLALCREWARYLMEAMPRTEEAGFQHTVSGHLNEGELWDDTMYMAVLFLARTGIVLKDDSCLQESIRQFLVHLKYLTDPRTGLFYHGWSFERNDHFAGALWARGNAWYTAGLVDYLDMAPLPEGVKLFLLSSLERQVRKLAELQTEEGMWHTLLDDPSSYVETSATAAFAYGMLKAVRRGYLDGRYRASGLKALHAVVGQIDGEGVVRGVSYGTAVGHTLQQYKDIPLCPMPYGQSMALLALVEGLKHLEDERAAE
ncbi:glycoside hydrolase family 88 protein [Paenibacillus sp. IB182493]|uniref:Glycoside hydrolase family 88 protein n=2 Tax=Paenibacillus arenilitoris TaxID=2772299 RepID=A0A927H467_9BACL|nr:glycoside hydrolase family 88 protein [Paenibacillus arenilitoris]